MQSGNELLVENSREGGREGEREGGSGSGSGSGKRLPNNPLSLQLSVKVRNLMIARLTVTNDSQ